MTSKEKIRKYIDHLESLKFGIYSSIENMSNYRRLAISLKAEPINFEENIFLEICPDTSVFEDYECDDRCMMEGVNYMCSRTCWEDIFKDDEGDIE